MNFQHRAPLDAVQLTGENTYHDSISLVRDRIDFLSEGDRDWLLRKTAEKVYFFDV